jgi:hypothetical protein
MKGPFNQMDGPFFLKWNPLSNGGSICRMQWELHFKKESGPNIHPFSPSPLNLH